MLEAVTVQGEGLGSGGAGWGMLSWWISGKWPVPRGQHALGIGVESPPPAPAACSLPALLGSRPLPAALGLEGRRKQALPMAAGKWLQFPEVVSDIEGPSPPPYFSIGIREIGAFK